MINAFLSDEEIARLVRETLEEVGIPYENTPGGFIFHGLCASDFEDYQASSVGVVSSPLETSTYKYSPSSFEPSKAFRTQSKNDVVSVRSSISYNYLLAS